MRAPGTKWTSSRCRVPPAVAGRIERGIGPPPRFGRDVAVALVGRARRRRLGLAVGGDVGLEVVGDRSWQLGARRGALSTGRSVTSGPFASRAGVPAPEVCAGLAPGPHLPQAGTNSSAQGT